MDTPDIEVAFQINAQQSFHLGVWGGGCHRQRTRSSVPPLPLPQGFNKLMTEQKDKNRENVMVVKKGFLGVDQLNELEVVRRVPPTHVCPSPSARIYRVYQQRTWRYEQTPFFHRGLFPIISPWKFSPPKKVAGGGGECGKLSGGPVRLCFPPFTLLSRRGPPRQVHNFPPTPCQLPNWTMTLEKKRQVWTAT